MQITIQLSPAVASALARGETGNPEARELLRLEKELGIRLRPLHPGTADPQLASYFTVEVAEASAAQDMMVRLRKVKGVEAAYTKPPDELP